MTKTGIFMRCAVRPKASFHWAALSLSTRPERSAATKTPVPAADSQLIVNFAASGLALIAATGGIRCTMLCNHGISQAGSESVPAKGEPNKVVANFTSEKTLFRYFLKSGIPQSAQQMIRIPQGIQAWMVSFVE